MLHRVALVLGDLPVLGPVGVQLGQAELDDVDGQGVLGQLLLQGELLVKDLLVLYSVVVA